MNGIVNVLKPPGMSSHQVVGFLRRELGTKKIGHTGTLDPGASGVLPLVVGNATKLSGYLTDFHKTYVAELTLGISTTTQDASGDTMELNTGFAISPRELAEALASFQGTISQVPPMSSAIRVGGQRLYELDRRGVTIPREPREVQVYSINIERIWSEGDNFGFGTRVLIRVVCSKGTYIRTLCHDLGEKLGVGAHMSSLVRTASGPFTTQDAYTLEEISNLVQIEDYSFLLPMEAGLPGWIKVKVHPLVEERIQHGNFILPEHFLDVPSTLVVGDEVVLMSIDGEVLALAEIKKTDQLICQPFRVFARG
ncbi:MAG: tRNA pseudouridine(55) synthase TruB [Firmicutes bacterium]|nr:tRNA pseudouridine(55) synthase TruB [Bacillota bacterium]